MEQYKCCGGNAQEEGPVSRTLTDDKKVRESSKQNFREENCYDGQKCPGFGKCSPANTEEKEEGGLMIYLANSPLSYLNLDKTIKQ